MTELEAFAVELSHEAARTALPFFRGEFAQENKAGPGAFDPSPRPTAPPRPPSAA